jgi:hypothetical protein
MLPPVVHIAADLPQFLQRRELAAYEQRLARTAYAYGVDLRRAQWLSGSTVGDPLMRAVDRRWTRLVQGLEEDSLRPQRKSPPTALLEEVARLIHMLRAPLPTLRLLRSEVASQWPAITPLGTTQGGIHWLVLDLDRVMAMPADERTFVLAAGLGHLQCEHGPIFAAHLMAHRGTGTGERKEGGRRPMAAVVRGLLRPWAKVAVFSADRAGLVAVASLPVALRAVERLDAERVGWMPRWPALETRRRSLEDFDKSSLMARRRLLATGGVDWAIAPPGREEELDTLTRKIAAAFDGALRLGGRLAMRIEGHERRGKKGDASDEASGEADPGTPAEQASGGEPANERTTEREEAAASASESVRAEPVEAQAPPIDPERASLLEQALRQAWSLARCDQRLTKRLGLL